MTSYKLTVLKQIWAQIADQAYLLTGTEVSLPAKSIDEIVTEPTTLSALSPPLAVDYSAVSYGGGTLPMGVTFDPFTRQFKV